MKKPIHIFLISTLSLLIMFCFFGCNKSKTTEETNKKTIKTTTPTTKSIDTVIYDAKMRALANRDSTGKWPVKAAYPLSGAVLPYHRIIAFYGNLYSKRMGILGELPKDQMLAKLEKEVSVWNRADTTVFTIPALHYVAITAQSLPGKSNKYRIRMPFHQIDTILKWAEPIQALVFLDVQVGHSTIKEEVPTLEHYLELPNVHLGIDPEYSMKNGEIPCTKIGTFTAADINDAIDYLANVVRKNNLPPKVLVVHRFTQGMITNYREIKTVPEVQVVINMDGFGDKALKTSSYRAYVYREPVQFTGFKLFYKNDTRSNPNGLYTPEEILQFTPKPIYIQYQ